MRERERQYRTRYLVFKRPVSINKWEKGGSRLDAFTLATLLLLQFYSQSQLTTTTTTTAAPHPHQPQNTMFYWKCVLGLDAEKTFLCCFDAGRRILCGKGNLILELWNSNVLTRLHWLAGTVAVRMI